MKNNKQKKYSLLLASSIAFILFSLSSFAVPVPHGVDGTIYMLDGVTPVQDGISFSVENLNNGHIVSGTTGRFGSGKYSVSIKGEDGDTIVVKAWTEFNQVNRTETLQSVLHNLHLLLNTSDPVEQTSQQIEQVSEQVQQSSTGQSSSGSAFAGQTQTVIETFETIRNTNQQVPQNVLQTITRIEPPKVKIRVVEGSKPEKTLDKLVYNYFTIENYEPETIVEFKIKSTWLSKYKLIPQNIQLYVYIDNAWQEVTTKQLKSEESQFASFITTGNHFAISIKENVNPKLPEPESSSLRNLYRITGILYETNGIQMQRNAEFLAENTRTTEITTGKTGIGPVDGAYLFHLHGRKDDVVELTVENKKFYTTLDDKTNLDFILNPRSSNSITGNVVHSISSSFEGALVASLLGISLLVALYRIQLSRK